MTTATNPDDFIDRDHQLALAAQRKELLRVSEIAQAKQIGQDEEDVIDLRELWSVLMRRKRTVLITLAVAVVVALLVTFNSIPIYRSTLVLSIERQADRVVDFQDVTPTENPYHGKDFYETQYQLLQSRSLARRVVDELGLEASYAIDAEDGGSFVADLIRNARSFLADDVAADNDAAPEGEDGEKGALVDMLLDNLTVSPVKNSHLVEIYYVSPDSEEAAAIANSVAKNYIEASLERRYEANSYAKRFLEERLEQVRANLEDSERRFVSYGREREIVNLDDKLENLLQTLKEMSTELVAAESARIQAEAEYEEMVDEAGRATLGVLQSPVIQKLKERKADLEIEYQEQLKVFKPGYPKMQQLQRQIAEVNKEIAEESSSIANSAKSDFEAKVRRQATLQSRISEIKNSILELQDRSTDFQTLKREVETNREFYDGLLQRMKEVTIVAGIGVNNISVIDRAEVPMLPYKPNLAKNLAIAIAIGLFSGILLVFLFETMDDTIKTTEDLERRTGVPLLGVIPLAKDRGSRLAEDEAGLLAFEDPKSPLAEAVRSLRASLIFSTSEGAPKILHFTSSNPGEGKTTTATSTAIAFAQAGSKVLLIDADLRNPSLHKIFGLPNAAGLTNYLAGDAKPAEIAQPTQVTRLFTVTSGPLPPDPVELLSSAKMIDMLSIARERFDHIVIDGPPVIGLADALVLANLAKATIFVAEAGSTRSGALEGSVKRLRAGNATIIGCVLDKLGATGTGYGYGYGYDYHYTYTYGGGETTALPKQS